MLYQKKKNHMRTERAIFFTALLLILVLFIARISGGGIVPVKSAGLVIGLTDQYTMGKVYDRNSHLIVQGSQDGGVKWAGSQNEKMALSTLFGPSLEDTYMSRMTIWGMAPELFGYEDNKLNFEGLTYPREKRTGGNVQLTIDKDLQTYVADLLKEKGYDKASVVVSNWKSGEILAAVSLPGFLPGEESGTRSSVFNERYSTGSTMKIVLAAAALSIDPELEKYTYNCTPVNHIFHTEEGDYRINCAGNASHGEVGMADAVAESCNGYFVSLLQQLPKEELEKELKKWGFDTTISFEQFAYWDQSFSGEDTTESEYLLGAIGQGNCLITPLGMNLCTNVLLDYGKLHEPCLILARSASQKDKMESQPDDGTYEVCSGEAADTVREMMLGVTAHGTGTDFYMPGFAAKTGTAQKADKDGNLTNLYTIWTTGGLIAEDTPYSITVCLDNVNGDIYSAYAGETAKEILEYMTGGEKK